ncbi:MAG: tRNA 2-thiouridine(34) synthase MnmA [Anaplasmataceae bacterium]|nr:tRNA 2-thiouridine(34) synthase MnmA [Anaplasmataceae bacterium]
MKTEEILSLLSLPKIEGRENASIKIMVAMSGGIDSSTVAAILAKMGYEVIGVTLQLYSSSNNDIANIKKGTCCAGVDIMDAKRIASKFSFPHYVLDYEDLFKEEVVDYFIDSYLDGYTPIPCTKCNQTVKFRDLLNVAKKMQADFLVTGHYALVENDMLYTAVDHNKDQTYYLFSLTPEQLKYIRFPLGNLTKPQTRHLAQHFLDLEICDKPDSQDICFVENGKYSQFIEKLRPGSLNPGNIIDIKTNVILGQHQGIIKYTIGQRRGLDISSKSGNPLYVIKIDGKNNIVYVGEKEMLLKKSILLNNVNWCIDKGKFNSFMPSDADEATLNDIVIKIRAHSDLLECMLKINNDNKAEVILNNSGEYAIAPGQACVIYKKIKEDSDKLLLIGGGWIEKSENITFGAQG